MTRIIAGRLKGQRLQVPSGHTVRPTTDFMRERIFSMLTSRLDGGLNEQKVIDLYAGTGALGFEALSRGAAQVTFVEKDPKIINILKANIRALGVDDFCHIIRGDAQNPPTQTGPAQTDPADIIFMDPPYGHGLVMPTLQSILVKKLLQSDGMVIVEQATKDSLPDLQGLQIIEDRRKGPQRILFLKRNNDSQP